MSANLNSWREKQRHWQRERDNLFQTLKNTDSTQKKEREEKHIIDTFKGPNYQLIRVKITDSHFVFPELGEGIIELQRFNNYIFDLSHPSNTNHQLMISRNPSSGSVRDLGIQGIPGSMGAFISIYVGSGRPTQIFYYCTRRKGMGGRINIVNIQDTVLE